VINCSFSGVYEKKCPYRLQEKSLYKTWLFRNFPQAQLLTAAGKTLSIIDPGKRNVYEGPDFKDAQIFIDGKLHTGDVEIHISNHDWYSHRHHEDPAYNNVILHVVTATDSERVIRTQSGKAVPVFIISPGNEPDHVSAHCSLWTGIDEAACKTVLAEFADIRFKRKGLRIKKEIIQKSANHSFYKMILDGLGYNQNRESFRSLADQLPLAKIYSILEQTDTTDRITTLEALFLGTAGFIDEPHAKYLQKDTEYFHGIKEIWTKLNSRYDLPVMQLKWHFAGIRPANFPTRRLIALAQIICKFFPDEPAQLWINLISTHNESKPVINWVSDYFQQPAGMWKNHPLLRNFRSKVLIGSGRMLDMLSNLLLPFSWAVAALQENSELMNRAVSLSRKIPRGEIPAVIKRWSAGINLSDRFFAGNYLIQGAIELHHSFCDLELCKLCPLEDYADR